MTVSELIEKLKEMPQDSKVQICFGSLYEDKTGLGYNDDYDYANVSSIWTDKCFDEGITYIGNDAWEGIE